MGLIPTGHDAAAVFVARVLTGNREEARAFSSAARARRWAEEQIEQSIDWDTSDGERWKARIDTARVRVERIPLHDPVTLKRRYPDAFNGKYEN